MAQIRFGSNTFESDGDFTVFGTDDRGNIVIGGFGHAPLTQVVWVKVKGSEAYLNADIKDADGHLVLQIRDNMIAFNKDNVYEVTQIPDNQIPPKRVIVTNQYGETALDLQRVDGVWDLNCDFYHQGNHVVATADGTELNPPTPQV